MLSSTAIYTLNNYTHLNLLNKAEEMDINEVVSFCFSSSYS